VTDFLPDDSQVTVKQFSIHNFLIKVIVITPEVKINHHPLKSQPNAQAAFNNVVASYQSLRFFYKCARHKPSLFNVIQISL
jgi:hypothetical protein